METALLPRQPVKAGGVAFDAVMLGDGPPTVVFANGMGSPLEEWALVAPTIAERCRVVCYDRRPASLDGVPPTHDAAQMAADLHHLLDTLGVSGRLVLVGHSWGGVVIRRYAVDHPDDVAGMVFVDATHENIKGMIPNRATRALYELSTLILRVGPIRRRLLKMLGFDRLGPAELTIIDTLPWRVSTRTSRAEYAGTGVSCQELARIAPELPHVPTRVLLAGGRGLTAKLGARQLAAIRTVWEQAVAGVSEATLQSVPDSGHYISLDQPQAVIDAIDDVITQCAGPRSSVHLD
jgi:pimeloyl-ACP methyl ester carboxylesterase